MGLFSSGKEQWKFMNEKDPRLFGKEKADWRREKARIEAERKAEEKTGRGKK